MATQPIATQPSQSQIQVPYPEPTPTTDAMAISLSARVPEFWADQPRVWFIRTEAVLAAQKMGDEAKFDIVVSKLPKEVITLITDFVSRPPTTGKYEALKNKLLSMLEDTKNRRKEKMMGDLDLGDQKPSQFLCRMKDLAKDNFPDDTVRIMWQNRLPTTVRAVLVASEVTDLERLGQIADSVMEATRAGQVATVQHAVPQGQPIPGPSHDTALIMAEIAKLSVRMMDLERSRPTGRGCGGHRRSFRRSVSRKRTPSRNLPRASDNPDWLCYYHYRFGPKAVKCVQPYAWGKTPTPSGN